MRPLTLKKFRMLFPGPFHYQRDKDGVDDTYDIYCTTTGNHVISTHFWDDSLALELKIQVICAALNHRLKIKSKPMLDVHYRDRQMYLGFCPGPFAVSQCYGDMEGDGWEVICISNNHIIISSFASPSEAKMITSVIADALNQFAKR